MTPDVATGYPVLSGETLVVPILGDPIAQVKSPDGITRALVARGRDAVVVPMHVLPDDLDTVVRGLGPVRSIVGLIATVPHKFGLAAHCATRTDRAAFLGSVNIARRNIDGTWHGDQVDGAAFVAACRTNGATLQDARALQVGAGGAGSAIALALLDAGVAELTLHDADPARLDTLAGRLRDRFGDRVTTGPADPDGHGIVANATPMGMREGDPLPVDAARLKPDTFVGDVITKPAVSPLIAAARQAGCATSTGTDMFAAVSVLIVDFLTDES
ncbi:MAG: shikimate dehydrogenase [Pseudonocardia sp.]|nr:shikimate dehydrogenase [Pseudonocardia sp.]